MHMRMHTFSCSQRSLGSPWLIWAEWTFTLHHKMRCRKIWNDFAHEGPKKPNACARPHTTHAYIWHVMERPHSPLTSAFTHPRQWSYIYYIYVRFHMQLSYTKSSCKAMEEKHYLLCRSRHNQLRKVVLHRFHGQSNVKHKGMDLGQGKISKRTETLVLTISNSQLQKGIALAHFTHAPWPPIILGGRWNEKQVSKSFNNKPKTTPHDWHMHACIIYTKTTSHPHFVLELNMWGLQFGDPWQVKANPEQGEPNWAKIPQRVLVPSQSRTHTARWPWRPPGSSSNAASMGCLWGTVGVQS